MKGKYPKMHIESIKGGWESKTDMTKDINQKYTTEYTKKLKQESKKNQHAI